MLQYTVESICNSFKALLGIKIKPAPKPGPNTLEELLKQFDLPPKEKTVSDVIRNYLVQQTMASLEVEMLRMDPATAYVGYTRTKNDNETILINFVPCVVRPEVIYCTYGKN